MSFRGHSFHTLDAKGRVSIPPRFRDLIKGRQDSRLVIAKSDLCLTVYPLQAWEELEEKIDNQSLVDKDIRTYKRFLIASAYECVLDSQSRILIPSTLREYADLKKEVVLAGQLKYFEIWDKQRFEEEQNKANNTLPSLEDKLASIGLL